MLKLSENPTTLPPEVQSVTDLDGTWWVAHTKARCEKAFARDMLSHAVSYFLPMREKTIFSGGRRRRVMLPLFSSYVFICGTENDRYRAMTTNRLYRIIEVADQERLVNDLAGIEKALKSKTIVDHYPRLPAGARCRVVSGPLAGTDGIVIERNIRKARVVIDVTILAQGIVLEIDPGLLEPIE